MRRFAVQRSASRPNRRRGVDSLVVGSFGMAIREAPVDLPDVRVVAGQPFGIYVHVPFCSTRCGYCDFNTYTPAELGGRQSGRLAAGAAGGTRSWPPRGCGRRR